MRILVYPLLKRGHGSGHLRRSQALVSELGAEGFLLLEDCLAEDGMALEQVVKDLEGTRLNHQQRYDPRESWDAVVLDRRSTKKEELARFAGKAPLIGIDEGGKLRDRFSYLIDILPGTGSAHPPNLQAGQLLNRPNTGAKALRYPFREVLISFGGEDPQDLSGRLLRALLAASLFQAQSLTLVEGPFFSRREWPPGVRVLRGVKELGPHLSGYDLLFTAYGLTCFEALAAGLPVILLNPTPYHRRLSRRVGIPEIGVRTPRIARLKRLLGQVDGFQRSIHRITAHLGEKPETGLRDLLKVIPTGGAQCCPVCRRALNPALVRFTRRTYFRCQGCGIIYLFRLAGQEKRYDEEYFFREYKDQYGKTYLEDFPHIEALAGPRLKIIDALLSGARKACLLDVGCAYGPFLKAARQAGYNPLGCDVSPPAVGYVRRTLGIPCLQGDFVELEHQKLTPGGFQVVTMWFVIEHFRHLDKTLRRVNRLLEPGGLFAFSTPNGAGVSARRDLPKFLEQSPPDHFSVWTPASVSTILARHGFRVRRSRITGLHPERFPGIGNKRRQAGGAWEALLLAAGRILRLGDTFEVYAEKVEDGWR